MGESKSVMCTFVLGALSGVGITLLVGVMLGKPALPDPVDAHVRTPETTRSSMVRLLVPRTRLAGATRSQR